MKTSTKVIVISLAAVTLGFLAGFIPEHFQNARLVQQNAALDQREEALRTQLKQTQNELTLSNFTVRSALVYTAAQKNNFSVASEGASALFTDLRTYVDQTSDERLKEEFVQILSQRDAIISALAKADPAVTQRLQQIFLVLESGSEHK